MGRLLRELRRRRVFRITGAYVVGAWVLLQVADLAFQSLGLPDTALGFIWIAVFVGFPIAVLFAWRYDITADGIVRTPPASDEGATDLSLKRPDFVILAALTVVAIAAAYGVLSGIREIDSETALPTRNSIAVLPLSNLSANPNNQFLADGLVEDMLNRLSNIEGLKVISRTSSEMYRDKGTKSVRQIAQELGVTHIVEGSVQRQAGRARINVQLIDAQRDAHLWSRRFDRELKDVFEIQSEIAMLIAAELDALLTAQQTTEIRRNQTISIEAFEAYALGRFHWNKRTPEGYLKSIEYFEQAIEEDPDYGLAYAGLADTYNLMALQGHIDEKEGRDKAVELALIALALDSHLAEAHNVLASIYTYVDRNWAAAEEQYLKALAINPNYATAHHYYSEHLSITGRHDLARAHINTAIELNPLSFVIRYVSMKLHFHRGNFQQALADNQRSRELNQNQDHRWIAIYDFEANYFLGNEAAALDGFKRYYGHFRDVMDTAEIDRIYGASGLDGLIRRIIELADEPWAKALSYGLLGDKENALGMLEKAFEENSFNPEFPFFYHFRDLHAEPRFQELLKRMGLPGN